jgi:hypothetical protein
MAVVIHARRRARLERAVETYKAVIVAVDVIVAVGGHDDDHGL